MRRRIAAVLVLWAGYAVAIGTLPGRALPPRAEAVDAAARSGRRVWERSGCGHCHALHGLGGHRGPDLTDAHGRLGASAIAALVAAGPGAMPAYALDREERRALVAFLAEVDAGGRGVARSLAEPVFAGGP